MLESDQHIPTARLVAPPADVPQGLPVNVPTAAPRLGVRWGVLTAWAIISAAILYISPHRGALAVLPVVLAATAALYNSVGILAARLCGVAGVEEFAIGLAPTLAVFRFRGVLVRLGGFVAGGHVKFPSHADPSAPSGFTAMRPHQGAVVAIAAPLVCFAIGWLICLACGVGDILHQVVTWIAAGHARSPSLPDVFRSLFAGATTLSAFPRTVGFVLLYFGTTNLLLLALQYTSLVIGRPARALLGREITARIGAAVDLVLVLAAWACMLCIGVALAGVVFKG